MFAGEMADAKVVLHREEEKTEKEEKKRRRRRGCLIHSKLNFNKSISADSVHIAATLTLSPMAHIYVKIEGPCYSPIAHRPMYCMWHCRIGP